MATVQERAEREAASLTTDCYFLTKSMEAEELQSSRCTSLWYSTRLFFACSSTARRNLGVVLVFEVAD